MATEIKARRGRPRLSDEERKKSLNRSAKLRRCASLARNRTLMDFKTLYPEEYQRLYTGHYKALKRTNLD